MWYNVLNALLCYIWALHKIPRSYVNRILSSTSLAEACVVLLMIFINYDIAIQMASLLNHALWAWFYVKK